MLACLRVFLLFASLLASRLDRSALARSLARSRALSALLCSLAGTNVRALLSCTHQQAAKS